MQYYSVTLLIVLATACFTFIHNYDYYALAENFIVGKTSVVGGYPNCNEVTEPKTAMAYNVQTAVQNQDTDSKSIDYILLVSDSHGFTEKLSYGTFEIPPKTKSNVGCGSMWWIPQKSDNYTIKIFIWSASTATPLADVQLLKVYVKNNTVTLEKGQQDDGLTIKDMSFKDKTVTVVLTSLCRPIDTEVEKVLHLGEKTEFSSYAYARFLGFDDDKAKFVFRATGGDLCMRSCHHEKSITP